MVPFDADMSRQCDDMSVTCYVHKWMQYLFVQYLGGVFLSDRYFIERFLSQLGETAEDSWATLASRGVVLHKMLQFVRFNISELATRRVTFTIPRE